MAFWTQLTEQIKKIWSKLNAWQKATILGVAVLSLSGILVFAIRAANPDMEPMYTNLDPVDAGAIVAKLKELNVDYQLADEGKTIMVPSKDKYQLRLDMAGQVNLNGVVGFESYEETRFGETDTDKRVRFLIALQGELTRTIEELDEVEIAKVHLALPTPSLFIEDQKETTASVLLRLKPFSQLKPEQVRSIMAFVASSVEGLQPAKVTVMDVNGNLLSDGLADDNPMLVNSRVSVTQLALKKQYEQELAGSIQSMLEKMRGPGKALVRATVNMDFDQVESKSETVSDPVMVNEVTKEESSSGSDTQSGGNPIDSNTSGPSYGAIGTSGTSQYQLTERSRNYEVSKTVETKIAAPGKVINVSLSVIIDGDLNTEEQTKITEAVSMAAGIDRDRGDQVSVVGMPFNMEEASRLAEELAAAERNRTRMEYLKMLLPAVCLSILALIVFLVLRRYRGSLGRRGLNVPAAAMAGSGEMMDAMDMAAAADEMAITNKIKEKFRSGTLTPEMTEKKAMKSELEKLAQSNPEEVANVIKTWLLEE